MFDNIRFFTYQIPAPITPDIIDSQAADGAYYFPAEVIEENMNQPHFSAGDNIKNASYCLNGTLDIFMRPPALDESLHELYYMEAFSIFTCQAGFFTRRRDYHSYMILYTYEGNGRLDYAGKTYQLKPGDGFFIDCMKPHFYCSVGSLWKHGVLHLNGPLLPMLYKQYLKNNTAAFTLPFSGHYQKNLENLLHIYSNASAFRDWEASDCISHMLTELLKPPASAKEHQTIPENIQYLIAYMENHFSMNITLDYLAEFSGISKYYLSREFKKYTGFSPIDYLIQLRIEHAKTLLKSTNIPANKIAHTVGIHDMNNFTNLFKKKTQMTPGEYRQR